MCEFSGDIFPNPESHGGQLSRKFAAGFFRMNKWGCPGLSKLCLSICLYSIWVHIGPDRTREAPKWWPPGVQPWDQQDAEDTGSSWRHTCCAMDSTRMRGERRPLATCGPSQDIGQLAFGPELSNDFSLQLKDYQKEVGPVLSVLQAHPCLHFMLPSPWETTRS